MIANNVLITGGSGFIGYHLISYIRNKDLFKNIISIDALDPVQKTKFDDVIYIKHDLKKELPSLEVWSESTVIFHLAAIRDYPGFSDDVYLENNIDSTKNIINFAIKYNINNIFFTSTMSVYPVGKGSKNEEYELNPSNIYGYSKKVSEELLLTWANNGRRRLIICRPAVIFGKFDKGNFTRLSNFLNKGFFIFPGSKKTIKGSGYVKDLIKSFFFTLEHSYKNNRIHLIYNFAFKEKYTIEQIVNAVTSSKSLTIKKFVLPIKLLNFISLFFELMSWLGLKNSINRERISKLYLDTDIHPDWLTKANFIYDFDLYSALDDWYEDCNKDFY